MAAPAVAAPAPAVTDAVVVPPRDTALKAEHRAAAWGAAVAYAKQTTAHAAASASDADPVLWDAMFATQKAAIAARRTAQKLGYEITAVDREWSQEVRTAPIAEAIREDVWTQLLAARAAHRRARDIADAPAAPPGARRLAFDAQQDALELAAFADVLTWRIGEIEGERLSALCAE
jgi:hypothetical protein